MDFTARYVLIKPSSTDDLESQLQAAGVAETEIKAAVDKFREQLDETKAGELYDTIIVNDDLEKSHQSLVEYLYAAAKSGGSAGENDEDMQEEDGKEEEAKGEADTMEE
jgi:guanylate kinase